MRIEATTKAGFLVSMTDDEIAEFVGVYGAYQLTEKRGKKIEIGDTFKLHTLYQDAVATLSSYEDIRDQFTKTTGSIGKLLSLMKRGQETEKGE